MSASTCLRFAFSSTIAVLAFLAGAEAVRAQGFDPSTAQDVTAATGDAAATTGEVAATGAGAGIILTGTGVALSALKRSTSDN